MIVFDRALNEAKKTTQNALMKPAEKKWTNADHILMRINW